MAIDIDLASLFDNTTFDPVSYQYFHQLIDNRTIIFNCGIEEDVVEKVFLPLRDFEKDSSTEPITLILNSSGGSVTDGFFLAHYISHYSKSLNIIVTGYACSMATVILAAGGKNPNVTRTCFPCSYALVHDGYVAVSAAETKTAADIMAFNDKIDNYIRQFYIDNTAITAEEFDAHSRHQWFMFADEMKKYNLIDKIIGDVE